MSEREMSGLALLTRSPRQREMGKRDTFTVPCFKGRKQPAVSAVLRTVPSTPAVVNDRQKAKTGKRFPPSGFFSCDFRFRYSLTRRKSW